MKQVSLDPFAWHIMLATRTCIVVAVGRIIYCVPPAICHLIHNYIILNSRVEDCPVPIPAQLDRLGRHEHYHEHKHGID